MSMTDRGRRLRGRLGRRRPRAARGLRRTPPCSTPPTSMSPGRWSDSVETRRPARGRAGRARRRLRRPRRAPRERARRPAPRSRAPRRPTTPRTSTWPRCPGPNPADWVEAVAGSPLVAVGDDAADVGADGGPARCGCSAPAWRSTGTGATSAPSSPTWSGPGRRGRWPTSTTTCSTTASHRLFPGAGPDAQRDAAATAVRRPFTVIAGGPGTGKTTTVAAVLALLHEQAAAAGRPAAGRARRAHRQGGRPPDRGRPRSGRRRLDVGDPAVRAAVARHRGVDHPPAARLATRAAAAASATTGRTSSPTRSSSSTRPRWCRCR